jgi:lipoprotein-releasing system ATP-binding protein
MITGKQIKKKYGELDVLKGVDLHIAPSEIVSIVGSSGAGKTTLLTILGTLDKPTSGEIEFNGINITSLSEKKLAQFRNQYIGFVFQFHHLLPEFTALENICIPAFINKASKKEAELNAYKLLNLLGLEDRANHKPSELSGGEQQRVAVARALINNPKVIFADEPSGNLDSTNAQKLHELFFTLRQELKQTIVVVTHNELLANMADRKLVMKDGLIA